MMNRSVYTPSAAEAKRFGELPEWRASHKLNCACAADIEKAIRENFDGMHLNEGCAKPVIDKYGFSRVRWVLANTLTNKQEDGRFSQQNRQWLSARRIPWDDHRFDFVVESHPAVLYGFINEVRAEWDKLGLYDNRHIIPENDEKLDYEGRVLIFSADSMNESHLHPEEQLFYAESGFGCSPNASGTKIFGQFLWDGERCHITRADVVGAIRDECLPDWARDKLEDIGDGEDEGMVMS